MNQRKSASHLLHSSLQRSSSVTTFLSLLMLPGMLFNPITALRASASTNIPSKSHTISQAIETLPRPSDLESKLICRQAVEEVYWRHHIQPAENPTPKPDLLQVLPTQVLRAKVDDELSRSNALDSIWQRPISGAQLQAEMERMARSTRQPEVLSEVFAALQDDPQLIAECLARPVLVDR